MQTIKVPKDTPLHWRGAQIPLEPPVAFSTEEWVPECQIEGRSYQLLDATDPEVEGPPYYVIGGTLMLNSSKQTVMDVETGQILQLVFQ